MARQSATNRTAPAGQVADNSAQAAYHKSAGSPLCERPCTGDGKARQVSARQTIARAIATVRLTKRAPNEPSLGHEVPHKSTRTTTIPHCTHLTSIRVPLAPTQARRHLPYHARTTRTHFLSKTRKQRKNSSASKPRSRPFSHGVNILRALTLVRTAEGGCQFEMGAGGYNAVGDTKWYRLESAPSASSAHTN